MRAKSNTAAAFIVMALSASQADAQAISRDSIPQAALIEDVTIGQRIRITSSSFGTERNVAIHLPDGYEDNENRYPVLFVLGGDSYFVPFTGMTMYLASDGRMPEVIVVGVHIGDWVGEFTFTEALDTAAVYASSGGADRLRRFLSAELIPYLDANYRTQPLRILVGHSLGGLFAAETMTRYPDLFQVTIAISPSIFYNEGEWVDGLSAFLQDRVSFTHNLYLALANETRIAPYMDRAVDELGRHASSGLSHYFQTFPEESHVSVAIPALRQGLMRVFSAWSFGDVEMWTLGADGIKAHYDSLSTRFGIRIPLPLDEIVAHGLHAMERHQDVDAAIEMFSLALSLDEESAEAHVGLAEAYGQKGMSEEAIEHCRRALEIDPTNERAGRLLAELGGTESVMLEIPLERFPC
jgi:predicted alpha/beta superfamily hydrolase